MWLGVNQRNNFVPWVKVNIKKWNNEDIYNMRDWINQQDIKHCKAQFSEDGGIDYYFQDRQKAMIFKLIFA